MNLNEFMEEKAALRASVSLQLLQLQFQLLDLVVGLFRIAATLRVPQFGDLQLEVINFDGAPLELLDQALGENCLLRWRFDNIVPSLVICELIDAYYR